MRIKILIILTMSSDAYLIHTVCSIFLFSEHDCGASRHQALGWHVSFIKYDYTIFTVTSEIFAKENCLLLPRGGTDYKHV